MIIWYGSTSRPFSQLNKLGNLIEVRRDVASKEDPSSSVYSIRVLLGKDDEEIVVAARFLMNYIPTEKTVIFALCLKDYQPQPCVRLVNVSRRTYLLSAPPQSRLQSINQFPYASCHPPRPVKPFSAKLLLGHLVVASPPTVTQWPTSCEPKTAK